MQVKRGPLNFTIFIVKWKCFVPSQLVYVFVGSLWTRWIKKLNEIVVKKWYFTRYSLEVWQCASYPLSKPIELQDQLGIAAECTEISLPLAADRGMWDIVLFRWNFEFDCIRESSIAVTKFCERCVLEEYIATWGNFRGILVKLMLVVFKAILYWPVLSK